MIVVESSKTNSLQKCEGITIDTLDRLAMQKKVDQNIVEKVFSEL